MIKMMEQANHAVRAAKNVNSWGIYAATRYIQKRGVHPRLFQLARQLEAVKGLK